MAHEGQLGDTLRQGLREQIPLKLLHASQTAGEKLYDAIAGDDPRERASDQGRDGDVLTRFGLGAAGA